MAAIQDIRSELMSLLSLYNFAQSILHLANSDIMPQSHFSEGTKLSQNEIEVGQEHLNQINVNVKDSLCDVSETGSVISESKQTNMDNQIVNKNDNEGLELADESLLNKQVSEGTEKLENCVDVLPDKEENINCYSLRERKKTGNRRSEWSTRIINSYLEQKNYSDDSDHEPKQNRKRTKNPGLREPSSSRIKAQKSFTRKPLSIKDTEKDKQCPYCTETFFYEKGLRTHLEHAHQIKVSKVDAFLLSRGSLNESAKPNISSETTNIDAVQGINIQGDKNINDISQPSPLNEYNQVSMSNEVDKDVVLGTNDSELKDDVSVTGKNNTKQTGTQIGDTGITTGINNDMAANNSKLKDDVVTGINNEAPETGVNSILHELPSNSELQKPKPVKSGHIQQSEKYGHHKRRPKPKGKHYRPNPSVNIENQLITKPKSLKSEFVTVTHGIRKIKKTRKFKCKICKNITDSQAEANKHYRKNHPPVMCTVCSRIFNNPCSLHRHSYCHQEKSYPCRNCGRDFPFESDLSNHRLKHHRHSSHMCNHSEKGSICGKWFFAKSDLAKHAKTHSGIVHECTKCKYTTVDIRYLCAHLYTHSELKRYNCDVCGKIFKHHTQLRCHQPDCGFIVK